MKNKNRNTNIKTEKQLNGAIASKIKQSGKTESEKMIRKVKNIRIALLVAAAFFILAGAGAVWFKQSLSIGVLGFILFLASVFVYTVMEYYLSQAIPAYQKCYEGGA